MAFANLDHIVQYLVRLMVVRVRLFNLHFLYLVFVPVTRFFLFSFFFAALCSEGLLVIRKLLGCVTSFLYTQFLFTV